LRDYPYAVPVLAFAIAIPIVWSLVAALQAAGGDEVGIHRLTWTLQEASRFAYALLYFPLYDARRLLGADSNQLWLLPVMALCGITIALFLSHYALGSPDSTDDFLVFKGVFEGNSGGFRVFIGNQVLFIAALALLLAELAAVGISRLRAFAIALLLVSAYLSHTRGIWLGLSVVCAGVVVVLVLREVSESDRRRLLIGVGALAGVGLLLGIAILADALPRPSFLLDASAGIRVDQAPKLWDAFKANPVFGDGLGAVIKPRFVRDPAAPWSYELTYQQILFQMGAIGLIAVLALPVTAAWQGLRSAVRGELDAAKLAGATGILGVLVASATNPYLLSSFGMLSIVVGLSLIAPLPGEERLADGEGGRLREAVPASGPT
jgi:O-antigen ligase